MRGWISELRCDIDASARYLALEDVFVRISKGEGDSRQKDYLFKMPGMKKTLLDSFMSARNNSLLWQKTTMDANGKCTLHDRQGRELIAGDGIIPQINRYASKYNYSKMSMNVLNEAMLTMSEKSESPTGQTWAFVVNEVLWRDMQVTLSKFLMDAKTDGQFLYSNSEKGYIKVGATYNAYTWAGNTILIHVDRALSNEYPTSGYGIMVDLTADSVNGVSPIQMFTLEGKEFIENTLTGVGIKSGSVSTPVAGEKYIISGYAGIGVMNPYRSFVLIQNKL